ncbi:hypothetical protein FHX57_001969 [Paraburkholderia tropica]|uniref:XkdW family protein n=1 Tax=Paraburkholderia tropica TaxID=92647 RepID=UPI00161F87D5|nr:hypothetical protein [Paraburkholderia tropica]MBB2999638.1 hypothetical protein [Paraburkholderia tropica]
MNSQDMNNVLQYMFPGIQWITNYQLIADADGSNASISFWDFNGISQPTEAQMEAALPEMVAAQALAGFQQDALAAIAKSDITLLRCIEHGVSIPAEWVTYRAALRVIISAPAGTTTITGLPTRPAYPSGS